MIGVRDEASNPAKDIFRAEAKEVASYIRNIHHSRKISHIQVNYPETVEKLSKLQQIRDESVLHGTNVRREMPRSASQELVKQQKEYKLKDFEENMKSYIQSERFINIRKKEFNRETGRKAVVNQVIQGTAPMPNHVLFPLGATHEQILAMTGTLKAPDARKVPPAIPKIKKWKGDNVGWDG